MNIKAAIALAAVMLGIVALILRATFHELDDDVWYETSWRNSSRVS